MNRFALSLLLASLCAAGPAYALFGDDEARKAILELRARVAEQEKQLLAKDAELAARIERMESAQRGALEFANQLDLLRQEIARLRGQVDQLANELAQAQKRNRDLYGDLDVRLKKLEPSNLVVDGRPTLVDRAEQAAFDAALVQFRAGDFRGAATSLQAFIARYPESAYSAAAHYWLGNAYYQLKDYKSAIAAQQVVIDKHADSVRAPEALLNIAASQIELNDRRNARATLQRIIKDFPDSEAARLAKERLPATATR
jgi:tol-pal system protein YbgF